MSRDNETDTPMIYVRHCDPNSTGEGLGSHARRTLYPLLQVALHFGWTVVWEYDQQPCWKDNEYRKSYSRECLELGPWLGFDTKSSDLDRDHTIMVPLHVDGGDPRFGNLRGAPELIIFVLEEYISEHGIDKFVGRNETNCHEPVLITLFGRFEPQDDPTPPVLEWMHRRCSEWKLEGRNATHAAEMDTTASQLNIVLHVRVPEDICTREWKDANSVSHVVRTLEKVWDELLNACVNDCQDRKERMVKLDVFTEESFTPSMEDELVASLSKTGILIRNEFPPTPKSDSTIRVRFQIHRQTPLLPCVQSMAAADVFIPASSYLSSMAAFFHTSLIVLPNESTRHDLYFATHLKYQKTYSQATTNDEKKVLGGGESSSRYFCPIVRVEEEQELKAAITKLWRTRMN